MMPTFTVNPCLERYTAAAAPAGPAPTTTAVLPTYFRAVPASPMGLELSPDPATSSIRADAQRTQSAKSGASCDEFRRSPDATPSRDFAGLFAENDGRNTCPHFNRPRVRPTPLPSAAVIERSTSLAEIQSREERMLVQPLQLSAVSVEKIGRERRRPSRLPLQQCVQID